LGAILYECLTGRPPFQGATPQETLEQVRTREPSAPSALNRQVPRDLETICLKCLRKQPEQRYSSARELADDLGRFVRGEPVSARPVGFMERLRKWVRRRPAAAGLLAAVVLLLTAGGIGAWLLYQQGARQARTDEEVRGIVARARDLLEEGWQAADLAKLTKAEAEGNQAVGVARSGRASAAVQQQAKVFREDAAGRLERARKNRALLEELLDVSVPQVSDAYTRNEEGRLRALAQKSVDEQYAAAFRRWGLDVDGTEEALVVARLGAEPDVVRQELIAALDSWMLVRRQMRPESGWRRLLRVAEQLDRGDQHRRLRTLLIEGSPRRAQSVAALVGAGSPWLAPWVQATADTWRELLEVRGKINPRTEPALTVVLLARSFDAVGDVATAEQVLRQAATARPDQVVLLDALGRLLERQGASRLSDAIGYYRAARAQRRQLGIALGAALVRAGRAKESEEVLLELVDQRPDNPAFYFFLGSAVSAQGKYAAAEAALRKGLDLRPDNYQAYSKLGNALREQQKYAEAKAAYRKALALKPDYAVAYHGLGDVLREQQKYVAAEDAYRQAIARKPDYASAYNNLGNALFEQHKYVAAEDAYRRAIALQPEYASAYNNLGSVLNKQHKHVAAEAVLRQALALSPDYVYALFNLGLALNEQHRHAEAEPLFRQVIALKPDFAWAYNNLGSALASQQKHALAETALRKAIALMPKCGEHHFLLGFVLMQQARFDEAVTSLKQAGALLPAGDPQRDSVRQHLQQCRRYVTLNARLPKILRGAEKPASAAEQLELALVCSLKKYHAAAARFSRAAFAAEPKLAEVVPAGNRYNAACAAAQAGCGQGQDADRPDDKERAVWRRQALDWLRRDLAWWAEALDKGNTQTRARVRQALKHWQSDDDLAGVRARDALTRLPEKERRQWERLWSDVAVLLRRASEPE
jgi:tetratricopeptide (TPR) repeat protein